VIPSDGLRCRCLFEHDPFMRPECATEGYAQMPHSFVLPSPERGALNVASIFRMIRSAH
jgi:hypothetical protein